MQEIQILDQTELVLDRVESIVDTRELVEEHRLEGVEVGHTAPPYGELTVYAPVTVPSPSFDEKSSLRLVPTI
jgi:hypothetical protein